jgi:hypothetical protein
MLRARIVHDPPLDITWVSLYKVYVQFLHRTEMERQQKEAADRLEKARYALVSKLFSLEVQNGAKLKW